MVAKNLKTGERIEIELIPRDWWGRSKISGKAYNSHGEVIYELDGSWIDKIDIKNVKTGKT